MIDENCAHFCCHRDIFQAVIIKDSLGFRTCFAGSAFGLQCTLEGIDEAICSTNFFYDCVIECKPIFGPVKLLKLTECSANV